MSESDCRVVVRDRSGGFCELRLAGKDAYACTGMGQSMHHRRKRSQGGLWTPANVLHACGSGTTGCHGYVEANPATARRHGLWLYGGQKPILTPAQLSFRGFTARFLLDDEGSVTWLSRLALERLGQ